MRKRIDIEAMGKYIRIDEPKSIRIMIQETNKKPYYINFKITPTLIGKFKVKTPKIKRVL